LYSHPLVNETTGVAFTDSLRDTARLLCHLINYETYLNQLKEIRLFKANL